MIPHVNDSKEQLEEVDLNYNPDNTRHIKWHRQILLSKSLKVTFVMLLVGVVSPVLLYQFLYISSNEMGTPDGYSFGSCLVPRTSRLLCGLGNVTINECHNQCCYDFSNNMCFHRYPSRFSFLMDRVWSEDIVLKPRIATVPFKMQRSVANLRLSIDEVSSTHLTLTYYNSANESITGRKIDDKKYIYTVENPELNIEINSTEGHTVFDTLRGPLIASENIWEIAFRLTEDSLYGFGEIPIKEDTVKIIYNRKGSIESIPLIFARSNGVYHGLLIDISEPTEVSFRTDHRIVIKSITNFGLKFHVFLGPKPVDIMKDVMKLMKYENKFEYWMLGPHFCSQVNDTSPDINAFIREATSNNMPFESHCVTPIEITNTCENEQEQVLNEGARLLRNAGKRFIPHLSPHIIYEELTLNENGTDSENVTDTREETQCLKDFAEFKDCILKDSDGNGTYKGSVSEKQVIYPNYLNMSAEFMEHLWNYTFAYDGVVLENTWPLDESNETYVDEIHNYLPYFSENFEKAFLSTPQWNATYHNGEKRIFTHNKYANHFAAAINQIKPVPLWASSQWMNNNVYVNRQNVTTSWSSFHKELVEAALGGISGHWIWSTPVCGDTDNFDLKVHSSLCLKWYLASSYFPMIKIHSKLNSREPQAFTATFRTVMINAIKKRLSLGPYFYTTLQEGPLLRPMFYQFPEVEEFKDITSQFSVGDSLVIVPNLTPSQSVVHFWKPPGMWYEFGSGLKLEAEEFQAVTTATTEFDFFTAIRGGSIIVMQKDVKLSAERTRSESNLSLTIALNCIVQNITELSRSENVTAGNFTECSATGLLYLDSNRTLIFNSTAEELKIIAEGDYETFCVGTVWAQRIDEICIFGLKDSLNNYDSKSEVKTSINLCELDTKNEILFNFIKEQ